MKYNNLPNTNLRKFKYEFLQKIGGGLIWIFRSKKIRYGVRGGNGNDSYWGVSLNTGVSEVDVTEATTIRWWSHWKKMDVGKGTMVSMFWQSGDGQWDGWGVFLGFGVKIWFG